MKLFAVALSFILFFLSAVLPLNAADRFAVCDQCGFCVTQVPGSPPTFDASKVPSNWEDCRQCLYQNAGADPSTFDSLKIDPTTNSGPTPWPGRHYTLLGCIKTGGTDYFTDEGGAGSATQLILNTIFSISGGIAFLYLIYGAFLVITSQGNPERLNQGKQVIVGAVVGLIFVITSVFVVNLVGSGILKIPGFG